MSILKFTLVLLIGHIVLTGIGSFIDWNNFVFMCFSDYSVQGRFAYLFSMGIFTSGFFILDRDSL